ncbi:MAG TPA: nickel pincer cofactor biosynthesis protein LarC [Isosphaeraceae bacterium]|nr:nickel pincer cofactor biosynthesis protein LarC [Isosphaeraceae bacterium]
MSRATVQRPGPEASVRIAYFDCFSGISGDMTLGALVDAGVDPAAIQCAVGGLGLPCELTFETVRRGGFRATFARVVAPHEHAHRHLDQIETMIERAGLSPRQVELAKRIFRRLGAAESAVHGVPIETIHFHEVGAIDSIVDIVGAAVGLDLLGVDRIEASAVPTGQGFVRAAHGRMPLPAPGTAELLKGVPLAESLSAVELTTPTGAAILTTVAQAFGPLPAMTIEAIGLGAGARELDEQANILRLFVGKAAAPAGYERVWMLETNLDDLPGEVVGHTTSLLLAAGALDAFVTPVQMKKNRPGVVISVLCDEAKIPELEQILFRETTTLGIRRHAVSRHTLKRQPQDVQTPFGTVRGKLAWLEGQPPRFSPEYDDCARLAAAASVPLSEVSEAAHAAYARLEKPPVPAHEPHAHDHGPPHDHAHDHKHSHDHAHEHKHAQDHDHKHPHDHGHDHDHKHHHH